MGKRPTIKDKEKIKYFACKYTNIKVIHDIDDTVLK